MTASGYLHRADGAGGGATGQRSTFVRHALALGLLAVGIADLAAIDLVLLPRYLAGATQPGGPQPVQPPVVAMPVVMPVVVPEVPPPATPPVAEVPAPPAPVPPPPAEAPPEVAPAASEILAENAFPHVLFARNTSWLSPAAKETLGRLAATLAENPSRRVVISGHTDNVGPEELNRALSVERARRCGKWLTGNGVDPGRMDIQGFGSTRPLGGDRSPEAQVNNRRVEFDLR